MTIYLVWQVRLLISHEVVHSVLGAYTTRAAAQRAIPDHALWLETRYVRETELRIGDTRGTTNEAAEDAT